MLTKEKAVATHNKKVVNEKCHFHKKNQLPRCFFVEHAMMYKYYFSFCWNFIVSIDTERTIIYLLGKKSNFHYNKKKLTTYQNNIKSKIQKQTYFEEHCMLCSDRKGVRNGYKKNRPNWKRSTQILWANDTFNDVQNRSGKTDLTHFHAPKTSHRIGQKDCVFFIVWKLSVPLALY